MVYFLEPSGMSPVKLPPLTIFPIKYTQKILDAIRAGKSALPDVKIFDAGGEALEPVEVNSIIGQAFDPKLRLNDAVISTEKAWNIRCAVFPYGSQNASPDYETTQTILSTGVISSKEVQWNDEVKIKLTLTKLEVYSNS
jgi:hypothetical protein